MKTKSLLTALLSGSLVLTTFAADQTTTTDIGTLDKDSAEKAFPAKPPY